MATGAGRWLFTVYSTLITQKPDPIATRLHAGWPGNTFQSPNTATDSSLHRARIDRFIRRVSWQMFTSSGVKTTGV
jgi:hypothetical protein